MIYALKALRWVKAHPLLVLHLVAFLAIAGAFSVQQWRIHIRDRQIAVLTLRLNALAEASAALDARLKIAVDEITRRNAYRAKMLAAAKAAAAKDPTASDPLPPLIERALREDIR